ncbi:HDIG domain-containing protein [Prolixibacteraceae bacterium JC049]|nr:HDIG domain-containing protein [Prolixibacteraceae bacterium JC049]
MNEDKRVLSKYSHKLFLTLIFVLTVGIVFMLLPTKTKFRFEFQKGKPWLHETLIAPFSFAINKAPETLNIQIDSVKNQVKPYFLLDNQITENQMLKLRNQFDQQWMRYQEFSSLENKDSLKQNYIKLFHQLYGKGILEQSIDFHPELDGKTSLIIVNKELAEEQLLSSILSLKQAYSFLTEKIKSNAEKYGSWEFAQKMDYSELLAANLFYDEKQSQKVLEEALGAVSKTFGMVQSGERIISKGDLVTQHDFLVLESLRQAIEQGRGENIQLWVITAGKILLILVIFTLLILYFYHFRKGYLEGKRQMTSILLLVTSIVFLSAIIVQTNLVPLYIVPLTILPIMLRTFFDSRTALFVTTVTVLLVGFFAPNGYEYVLLQIVASFAAIVSLQKLHKRAQLVITAFIVIVSYVVMFLTLELIQEGNFMDIDFTPLKWFAANGILVLIAYPLIWLFEKMFGFVSDVTLMELSDSNSPLLRRLAEVAPGTFQHTIQVANIAEEAIRKIGGNPLLVRAGALYHDIGKSENPLYFTENQTSIENPHNQLSYTESAKIIIDHVIQGEELARKYNLPQSIVDFIVGHHGTSKTGYFYQQYKNENPDVEIDESLFAYPGPNPKNKEVAVVMMADTIEAACRSLPEKTEESLRNFINRLIDGKINEGLLEESDLTFADISLLKKIFLEKLINIYHVRIAYPEKKN